jgi:drug/metabolite transporter (DMT)-like permease
MSYVLFAALGALSFGFGNVVVRRAVTKVLDATIGVLITVPLGVIFVMIILLATDQVGDISNFSWQEYGWLSAVGILQYTVGRSLSFSLTQLVGANIGNILRRLNVLVAVVLAISILGEPLSWELVVGVLLILSGLTLAGMNPQLFRSGQGLFSSIPRKAYLLALGVGLSWGTAPILIKFGLSGSGTPIAGAFISYAAATIVLIPFLLNRNKRTALTGIQRGALGYFCLVAVCATTANLMGYIALNLGPASVVAPIIETYPILALLSAFVFNRKLEIFNRYVIIGTVVALAGSLLLV